MVHSVEVSKGETNYKLWKNKFWLFLHL
jgi:hypothetical protein